MTEADLQAQVIALAASLGLVALHVRQPRMEGGEWRGFPDLMIVAPGGGIMFRELKQPGKQLRAPQRDWAEILARQDYGVWKPADWMTGRVQAELHALAGQRYREPEPADPESRMWQALRQAAERDSGAAPSSQAGQVAGRPIGPIRAGRILADPAGTEDGEPWQQPRQHVPRPAPRSACSAAAITTSEISWATTSSRYPLRKNLAPMPAADRAGFILRTFPSGSTGPTSGHSTATNWIAN